MEETTGRKETPFEKHIQTILLSIITAFIITGVFKLFGMSEQIVRMEERDKSKTEKIDAMQATMNKMQMDMLDIKDRVTKLETYKSKHE